VTHVCSVPVSRATFVRFNEYDFRSVAYPLERIGIKGILQFYFGASVVIGSFIIGYYSILIILIITNLPT
jgi:hypothetical protein